MRALRTAASGMAAQQLNVEVISNNIANMNTVGFKKQRAEFQDLLYQNVERMGAQSSAAGTVVPTGIQIGAGVKAGAVYRVTEQGTPQMTGNPYDMAIDGKGYFQISLPSGEKAYTRAGNLQVNPEGQMVTDDGYLLEPAITIPQDATKVSISKTGLVQVTQAGQPAPTTVGQIELASFFNEAGLEAIGDNLLLETAASGPATVGVPGEVGYILPCLGRTEIDRNGAGKLQIVTVEDSMGMVHGSGGINKPASPHLRSEIGIVCGMAAATVGSARPRSEYGLMVVFFPLFWLQSKKTFPLRRAFDMSAVTRSGWVRSRCCASVLATLDTASASLAPSRPA